MNSIRLIICLLLACTSVLGADVIIDQRMHHLRIGNEREWDSFKGEPENQLRLTFDAIQHAPEVTLSLRQEDVKVAWAVSLNGVDLGRLEQDENPRVRYFSVPVNCLKSAGNILTITYSNPSGKADRLPDDILVGEIRLIDKPLKDLLHEGEVSISVFDKRKKRHVPSRITITTVQRALQPIEASPDQPLAVRTGCIYTSNGKASFRLPAGKYKIYASRGPEYSADSVVLEVKKGAFLKHQFAIFREVPTKDWVSSDTHIHTFTNSGHGDATTRERLLTIAGEDIDLPVFTDHNFLFDVKPLVKEMGLDTVFTPVNGNEFTTEVGHFNVFPIAGRTSAPDHRVKNWAAVKQNLGTGKQVIILNHARDTHFNFRPFGPERHISIAGQRTDGWELPANAMEVINSSSQQKDIMQLYRDWFGLLNRGHFVTPVGSSDSHDVMRYLVGQARTYIKYPDNAPAKISVDHATDQLLAGRVMTNFGLMAEITVNTKYGPGDLALVSGKAYVSVRVLGPSWIKAKRVALYANGKKVREMFINKKGKVGVKWEGNWTIPVGKQDVYLVAIAEGPDPALPFWIIPKPYARTSSVWNPQVIGSSGAVWIDADGDGQRTCAFDYAKHLLKTSGGDIERLIKSLNPFDESVSVQVASLLKEQNKLSDAVVSRVMTTGAASVKSGFSQFLDASEESRKAAGSK